MEPTSRLPLFSGNRPDFQQEIRWMNRLCQELKVVSFRSGDLEQIGSGCLA
jgi:hypothetical protein